MAYSLVEYGLLPWVLWHICVFPLVKYGYSLENYGRVS